MEKQFRYFQTASNATAKPNEKEEAEKGALRWDWLRRGGRILSYREYARETATEKRLRGGLKKKNR